MSRYLPLVIGFATTLSGCSDRRLSFGEDPRLLWWTDHETGDLADWLGKSGNGGFVLRGNSRVEVVDGVSRSGAYSLLIDDLSPSERDFPLAARNGPLPPGIYASAWYYLPAPIKPKSYWWFVLYRSRRPPYDQGSFRDEIRLSFTTRSDGSLGMELLTEELGTVPPAVDREIEVGSWFHIETYLRATDGDDGEFRAWKDGELVFSASGRMTDTTWVEWMTGCVADGLQSGGSRLYVDDAALSTVRLGPLPPFERH